nr:IS5 family transposase [Agrobacterium sp. rho-8.1]
TPAVELDTQDAECSGGLTCGLRRMLTFIVTAGQVGDITQAPALLEGQAGKAVLGDKAYDSNALRATIKAMNAEAVIPSNRTRKIIISHDPIIYKHRNRIERCFNRLKHFRRFATRYERRTIHFTAFIHLAAIMIWLR